MRTQAYLLRRRNGYYQVSKDPLPNSTFYYADWKIPTVKLWWEINKNKNLATQESLAWEILLETTNLVEPGQPTEKVLAGIKSFVPASLPHFLASELLKTTNLTHLEILQMEREAQVLWNTQASLAGRKFHPILEKVSNAIIFYEKLGVISFPDLDEIDTRTYQGILHALNCYGKMISLKQEAARMRNMAIRQSGVGPYVGPTNVYRGQ
jgi:hypothetical protein